MKTDLKPLSFGLPSLEAVCLQGKQEFQVEEMSLIVNLSQKPVFVHGDAAVPIAPWKSTLLCNVRISTSDLCAVIIVKDRNALAGQCLASWQQYGVLVDTFPKDVALFRSSQDSVGSVVLSVTEFGKEIIPPATLRKFEVRLNLWWCAGGTECVIHNKHDFLEIHYQVFGQGHMQKFRDQDPATIFEDVVLAPGASHDPFFIAEGATWRYPWHQYFGDTDCVWLVVELHPQE